MKNQLYKLLIALTASLLIAVSSSSFAAHGWHGGGGGWHGGGGGWHGGGGWNNNNWVLPALFVGAVGAAYYSNGPYYNDSYYGPSYGYRYCRWVRGQYDYYGYWIPPHRVCWY